MTQKIISGGQTGVDRAALDVAITLGIPHGGWCPKERWAEDGVIPTKYELKECDSKDPAERTKLNVKDSDATLILVVENSTSQGTTLTIDETSRLKKPLLIINPMKPHDINELRDWIVKNQIHILNIAGPRASEEKSIYEEAYQFLLKALSCFGKKI